MSNVRSDALLRRLRRDERGLTTVEYVIVLCLIAAGAVKLWGDFGDDVSQYLEKATKKIDDEMP